MTEGRSVASASATASPVEQIDGLSTATRGSRAAPTPRPAGLPHAATCGWSGEQVLDEVTAGETRGAGDEWEASHARPQARAVAYCDVVVRAELPDRRP